MNAFTLYESSSSLSCTAIEIALLECKVNFKRHELDENKPRTKAFLGRSPFGKVPVLLEHRLSGELSIWETPAILLFLAERFKDSSLHLNDLYFQSEVFAWVSFWDSEFGESILRAFKKPSEDEISLLEKRLDVLNGHLSQKAFLVGAYSIADVLATPFLDIIEKIPDISLGRLTSFNSWHERLRSRPSYQALPPPL